MKLLKMGTVLGASVMALTVGEGAKPAEAGTWKALQRPEDLRRSITQDLGPRQLLRDEWSFVVRFKWEPDVGKTMETDPPPPQVRLKITCGAEWFWGPTSELAEDSTTVASLLERLSVRRVSLSSKSGRAPSRTEFDLKHWRLIQRGGGGGGEPPPEQNTGRGAASVGFDPHSYSEKPIAGSDKGIKWAILDSRSGVVEYIAPTLASEVRAGENNPGDIEGTISGSVTPEINPRDVWISSSIDQSFKKSTTPPTKPADQPGPDPVPGSNPPVWRVPVPRGEAVHSVVEWSEDLLTWVGGGTFTSNETGFNAPWDRVWTSSASPTTQIASNQMAAGYNPLPPVYFNLGGNSAGGGITKSSSISVSVTDSNGTLSDTYAINWHRAVDEIIKDPSRPSKITTTYKHFVPFKVAGDQTVTHLNPGQGGTFTQDLDQVSVKAGAESWELVANLSAAIVGGVPAVGPVAGAILTWAGYSFGQIEDPLPEPVENGWAEWINAVNTQQGINAAGEPVGSSDEQRLFPPSMASGPHNDPTTDENFKGSTMSLSIRTDVTSQPILGDQYNRNGYVGPVTAEIGLPVRFKIYKFYQRLDPNPNPTP